MNIPLKKWTIYTREACGYCDMAKAELNPIQLPKNRYAAAVIIGFWLLFAGLCSYAVWHLVSN